MLLWGIYISRGHIFANWGEIDPAKVLSFQGDLSSTCPAITRLIWSYSSSFDNLSLRVGTAKLFAYHKFFLPELGASHDRWGWMFIIKVRKKNLKLIREKSTPKAKLLLKSRINSNVQICYFEIFQCRNLHCVIVPFLCCSKENGFSFLMISLNI